MMLAALAIAAAAIGQSLPPPSPAVTELLSARWLSPAQRSAMARFHGLWSEADATTPAARAQIAHTEWLLDSADLHADTADPLIGAEALLRQGLLPRCIAVLTPLPSSPRRDALLATALHQAGQLDAATGPLHAAAEATPSTVQDARAVLQMQRLLTRLTGDDVRLAARAQGELADIAKVRIDTDPMYWPLLLDEALLLQSRDNRSGAGEAIGEALQLNPRSAQAWFMLGQLQLGSFNFDAADASIAALRELDADHTLAHLLDAEAAIIQHRWSDAQTALDQINHPMPEAQALQCALLALQGRSALARDVFEAALHDRPGDARVAATTGRLLSLHRRYDDAERWLNDALAIDGTDHEQWSELGLMRWQAGLDADARTALRRASALNPFDRRAANSLRLLDDMDAWDSIDTGDVLIRWPPGIDAMLATAIAADVQHMHDRLERELQWTPSQQTVLEIHPDHEHFAVRVTGTPDVHTVAACTGPVIAMEPPRGGAPGIHAGPYDWGPVVQHELAHVAHLDISRSRVPLWFTEGAAVAHEPLPLDWSARELLARRWHAGSLLPFDDLSWAFVRPEHPEDRPLAYAQSAWFLLHLQDTWGPAIVGDILAALGRDVTLDNAFAHLTGQTPAAIWEDFIDQHATADLHAWGLLHQITPSMLAMDDRSLRAAIDDDPQNPAPLLAWLHRTSDAATDDRTMLLQRLCALRPLDPWPRRELAQRHRDAGEPGAAADVLQELAANRDTTPALLDDLAMAQRAAGRTESALLTMAHAVSMNPYDVPQRERAAALALEAGRLDLAQAHIEALVLLEPGESLHRKRLEALTRQR